MNHSNFQLNQQLQLDTHELILVKGLHILLHRNASIPWVIIVPETEVIEVYDLPKEQQKNLLHWTKVISTIFKILYKTEKMNCAAIGNIVSQLHIHVIGRKTSDACWPDIVWGRNYGFIEYTQDQIEVLRNKLIDFL